MSTLSRRVRVKKLNIKSQLPVLRENEINSDEYESLTQEGGNSIITGVEQAEEGEIHLQAVLQGAGISNDKEIPVPPPQQSRYNYDEIYQRGEAEPSTYIRFSQTVEDCIGCLYDLTEQDAEWLKSYDAKRTPAQQLSEDDLEAILEVYEDTATMQTPFAAIDKTVVPFESMEQGLQHTETSRTLPHAKEVYEHWRAQRQVAGNGPLHPMLKFETHQETDESDPYVCFRRREVRQTRKTRARDVQSADKLRRLRREIEDARQLIDLSVARERTKLELLRADREVHLVREKLKSQKIALGIKTDDEDLVNQKPQKKKPDLTPIGRPNRAMISIGRAEAATELVLLSDKLAERERMLLADIANKVENHRQWNKNHLDLTQAPLSPVGGPTYEPSFRPAQTEYLITPPASASDHSDDDAEMMDVDPPQNMPVFRFKGIQDANDSSRFPAYRRRIGRGGRLWIDRRGLSQSSRDTFGAPASQWSYDQDDSDDDQPVYQVDPNDLRCLKFRATIPISSRPDPRQIQAAQAQQQQREQQRQAQLNAALHATGVTANDAAALGRSNVQRPIATPG